MSIDRTTTTEKKILFLLLLVTTFIACSCACHTMQGAKLLHNGCKDLSYENRNPFELGQIELTEIDGIAKDKNGVPVPDVCIGLFSEIRKELLAVTQTDKNGSFKLSNIPNGRYRLVSQLEPFVAANAKIKINSRAKKKLLVLNLRLIGIDACSSFEVEK